MSSLRRSWLAIGLSSLALLGLAACVNQSTVGPVTAQASSVRVENDGPPAGARLVGPITVSDGDRCTLIGARGTRAGATVLMQEAAKRQGMDWVKVVLVTRPYEGHDCFHGQYTLKGIGYSLTALRPAPAPSAKPSVFVTPSSAVSALPVVASAAPVTVASAAPSSVTAAPSASAVATGSAAICSPPCSPGYACSAGVCVAECNPRCGPTQICRSDRVCVPAQ